MDGSGGGDPANPRPEDQVPALLHDQTLVTESAAVIHYLTQLFPDTSMAPRPDNPRHGANLTWLYWYGNVGPPALGAGEGTLVAGRQLQRGRPAGPLALRLVQGSDAGRRTDPRLGRALHGPALGGANGGQRRCVEDRVGSSTRACLRCSCLMFHKVLRSPDCHPDGSRHFRSTP